MTSNLTWQGRPPHGNLCSFSTGSSSCLLSPSVADSGPFKFASGGACTYTNSLEHMQRLHVLGRPGVWPGGGPIWMGVLTNHLGSITTLYLVQDNRPFTKCLSTVEAGRLHCDQVSAAIQRHMVGRRDCIGAQAAQPSISDSQSVLHQQQFQPGSQKVQTRKTQEKPRKWVPSTPAHYLLLHSSIPGRSTVEPACLIFPFGFSHFFSSKKSFGGITFLPRSIRKQVNSSETRPPLPVCIGLDSVGHFCYLSAFPLIPENAGHLVNVFVPFPPVCEPFHPVPFRWECSPTTLVA